MNRFDELMMLNEQLDAVLGDMKKANKHLENDLKAKRNAAQEQMLSDIDVLLNYMRKVGITQIPLSTGLCEHKGYVICLVLTTRSSDIGLQTTPIAKPSDYYFYNWFKRDVPFMETDVSYTRRNCLELMLKIMQNWDVAYENMQNDLFEKIQKHMAEKASKVTTEQSNLVAALDAMLQKGECEWQILSSFARS